jgi:hypothetical protein
MRVKDLPEIPSLTDGYTLGLLQTVAKRLGWSESHLEQFRSEFG